MGPMSRWKRDFRPSPNTDGPDYDFGVSPLKSPGVVGRVILMSLIIMGSGCPVVQAQENPPNDENLEDEARAVPDEEITAIPLEPKSAPLEQSKQLPIDLSASMDAILKDCGLWSYEFVWFKPSGERVLLSEHNPEMPMIPASTMKLFVAFFAYIRQPKIGVQLSKMLRFSLNAKADAILKASGGAQALKDFFQGLGFKISDSLTIYDGSGYDARNRSTARLQVTLLEHILRTPAYKKFKTFLAQPGQKGTLDKRLKDLSGVLYAKTGTLPDSGDVALAGYIESASGTVAFSVLGNDLNRSTIVWARAAIDNAVRLHYQYVSRFSPINRKAPLAASLSSYRELSERGSSQSR